MMLASAWAQNTTPNTAQDDVLVDMAAAFKKNDSNKLAKLLPRAKGHALESWAAYWALKVRLDDATQAELDGFYKRYAGTYVEDRLRADWLLLLGKNQDWSSFAANAAGYRMGDDKDIKCYANRDNAALVEKLWMSQKEVKSGCGQIAEALISSGVMPSIVAWRKNYKLKAQTELPKDFESLDAAQKNWARGYAARAVAQNLDLSALDLFAKVTATSDLSDDMLAWWARAALRSLDWKQVERVISSMSDEARQDPIWIDWLATARLVNRGKSAQTTLLQTAPAASTLMPTLPSSEAIAQAKQNKGLQRALLAIRIGLRQEGVREWNYETNLAAYGRQGGMNDEERLAAAAVACEAEVWDRCINTSERTKTIVNWSQRFPMPHKDALVAEAVRRGIDPAFVYGLIRQESRFVTDAKSHVGAAGLMQIMPATARWTANRIGLANFSGSQIHDINVNLTLGVAYLKYVLEENDGNPAYAAAAYNAGPHRVRTWRKAMEEDPAARSLDKKLALAIWSENIPFSETRDYVKKVAANTETYKLRLATPPLQ
jgi:soluble lytic murein transglycosylase